MRARIVPARGFTLLELLIVVVIIGLLASFVAPRYFGQLGKSEVQVARAQLQAIGDALDQFRLDVGRYPSSAEGLAVLTAAPPGEAKWRGPYLKKDVPADPEFQLSGESKVVGLRSKPDRIAVPIPSGSRTHSVTARPKCDLNGIPRAHECEHASPSLVHPRKFD